MKTLKECLSEDKFQIFAYSADLQVTKTEVRSFIFLIVGTTLHSSVQNNRFGNYSKNEGPVIKSFTRTCYNRS